MVSQAARTLMKFLSAYIFFVEYARAIVTASGSPSGIATTIMVTPWMKAPTIPALISLPPFRVHIWTMRAIKVPIANTIPT